MSTERKLELLRECWQSSTDRIADLSRLAGVDHATAAILIARELQNRQLLKEQILALTKEDEPA